MFYSKHQEEAKDVEKKLDQAKFYFLVFAITVKLTFVVMAFAAIKAVKRIEVLEKFVLQKKRRN